MLWISANLQAFYKAKPKTFLFRSLVDQDAFGTFLAETTIGPE